MSTTLPLFWHLSSSSKQDRIEASVKLVGALEQFQSNFTPFPQESSESSDEDKDEDEEMDAELNVSNDGLDGPNAPDVSYSIRRLVRGLASPRESSRLGFAVALTELLSRLGTISASQILSLITQASQIHGSMKGQEERDMLFARLFGIMSLSQSGILFRSAPLSTSSKPPCTLKDFQDAMEILLALPAKKSFLKEPSYWALILSLRRLNASNVEWKREAWIWVTERLFVEDKSWSPEKVGVALNMQTLEVKLDWKILLAPTFKNGDIISSSNLSNLAKILRDADIEAPDTGTATPKSSAAWRPQLHFVWNLILDIYFPPTGATPSSVKFKISFPEFFKGAVDDSLLTPTSSDGRKLWGFELFRLSLTRVPASELPRLFTPNFMRSWVNHLSKPDRYLHKAAKLVASSLPQVISANPSAGFPVLLQLLQTHGHFDRLTKTKTVESLLAAMDVKGVEEYVVHLGEMANKPSAKTDDTGGALSSDPTITRIWVADQLTTLVRNGSIPKADAWISNVLKFLLLHGLFGIRKKNERSENQWLHALPDPTFSDEARSTCRTRLLSCLAELTTQTTLIKTAAEKTVRGTGFASDGELWASKVLFEINSLEKDSKHVVRLGLDNEEFQEETALRRRTQDVIEMLKTVDPDRKDAGEGAELLLVASLLYRYLSEERDNDEDIETCLNGITRLFSTSVSDLDNNKKPKKPKKPADGKDSNDDNLEPMSAIVDTLIGYLENSTAYLRAIVNQVFTLMTGLVDKDTVDLILAQLERRDPAHDEDGEELSGPDEEDAQLDEDSSGSNPQDNDSDKSGDIEEDPELRRKIENALRVNGIQAANAGSDEESGSETSDDSIMDDDQMMRLDGHLAEIFRSRVKEKGRGEPGAQREATHFKNRVLDLVDIFLRKELASEHAPTFIIPLIQVIVGTGSDEKQLSDKVTALLRNRLGKAKEVPTAVDLPQTQKALEELHIMARKTHSPDVRETISICSLYLTRILVSESINDVQTVTAVYRTSVSDFATRKASLLQHSFIQDFVRRQPRSAWQLRNDFIQLAEKAVNDYRKCQTFQLLQPLFNQLVGIGSTSSEITDFIQIFHQAVFKVLSNACDDAKSLNTSQVKELLKLSLLAVRQTKRAIGNTVDLQTVWGNSDLVSLSKKLETSRFKNATSLHGLCRQLLVATGSSAEAAAVDEREQTKQKKRKAEDTKETDIKRARRKKNKKGKD